jgi:membrane-bound lytic murein transglycosylase D
MSNGLFPLPIPKVVLCYLLLLGTLPDLLAQSVPEVPNSVLFGGMNVKLDRDARRIIESDIRSLMANKRYWEDKLDRAVLYFPILEGALIEAEIPIDFKYLAVQESSLTPDAVSSSNAVGFWQFKRETALEMGLRVDNEVDERKNIASSTFAAARYLKRSNQQYNNWVSSLYSYYLGMGGISKIVPSDWAYSKEITLDGRTDRYVLRFFAHKIAFEAGLDQHRTANAIVLLEYRNGRGQNLNTLADEMGIDPLELRRYNRWMESDQIPSDRDYVLVLPVSSSQLNVVRQKLAESRLASSEMYTQNDIGFPVLVKAKVQLKGKNNPEFYEINSLPGIQARPGDKASDLAKAAKVSTSSFLKYNDLSPREPLVPGEVYYLSPKNKKAMVPYHTVREGETIRKISQIYGIRTKELLKYNRISNRNMRLQTGRVMWLMKKRPANKPVEILEIPAAEPGAGYRQPEVIIANESSIPQSPNERKKYTPKLVASAPGPASEPAPAADTDAPIREVQEERAAPANPPRSQSGNGNRIVIISQERAPGTGLSERPSTPSRSAQSSDTGGSTFTEPAFESAVEIHQVKSGQTYYSISRLYNIEISDLLAWNSLTLNDKLAVGQRLRVSKAPSGGRGSTARSSAAGRSDYILHKVAAGETLFSISKQYGVNMSEVQRANSMSDTNVKLGETMKIPRK